MQFAQRVDGLVRIRKQKSAAANLQDLRALSAEYKDLVKKLMEAAQPRD